MRLAAPPPPALAELGLVAALEASRELATVRLDGSSGILVAVRRRNP